MSNRASGLWQMFSRIRTNIVRSRSGQSTVEAVFIVPVLLLGVLLLVQPAILMYDRTVMESAANEACRLLATLDGSSVDVCEQFVRRRLGAVPQQDNFHVHSSGCTWEITCSGAGSSQAHVTVSTQAKPLPLLGFGAGLLGATNDEGNFTVVAEASLKEQPDWAASSPQGANAASWVGAWLE